MDHPAHISRSDDFDAFQPDIHSQRSPPFLRLCPFQPVRFDSHLDPIPAGRKMGLGCHWAASDRINPSRIYDAGLRNCILLWGRCRMRIGIVSYDAGLLFEEIVILAMLIIPFCIV